MKPRSYLLNLKLLLESISSVKLVYLLTCLFIIFVYLLTENTNVSMYELVADPNEVGQVAPYTGLVSTIGTLIFCAIVSICLFSAYLTKNTSNKNKEWSSFFKYSGYFILLLLVDDLWQIHENFSNFLFAIGVNHKLISNGIQNFIEMIVFGFYGLLFAVYILRFKKIIYQTELLILILAFGCFGLSTIIDLLLEDISGHFILEEGSKLLGIVSLMIYYSRVCYQKVRQFSTKF